MQHVLNAVRVLARMLPVLQEDPDDPFIRRVLWLNCLPRRRRLRYQPAAVAAHLAEDPDAQAAEERRWQPLALWVADLEHGEQDGDSDADGAGRAGTMASSRSMMGSTVVAGEEELSPLHADEIPLELRDATLTEQRPPSDAELTVLHALDYGQPVGRQLVDAVARLCFAPGLTVDSRDWAKLVDRLASGAGPHLDMFQWFDEHPDALCPEILWYPGLRAASVRPKRGVTLDERRVELLRLVHMMCAGPLFSPAQASAPTRSLFLDELVLRTTPLSTQLFASLWNAVLTYDPVGWGLPYGVALSNDSHSLLLDAASQALGMLLDYRGPAAEPSDNVYWCQLAGLSDDWDCAFLWSRLSVLLGTEWQAQRTWVPYSMARVPACNELLILLWRALEASPALRYFVLHRTTPGGTAMPEVRPARMVAPGKAPMPLSVQNTLNLSDLPRVSPCDVVPTLCHIAWEGRRNPGRLAAVHVAMFVLLLLSGDREFGVALCEEWRGTTGGSVPYVEGCYADLLVLTLDRLLLDSASGLDVLAPCVCTIMSNITPYVKRLDPAAASAMGRMWDFLASPRSLLCAPENHTCMLLLLESLNNIVQYQWDGNAWVAHAILQRAGMIRQLAGVSRVWDLALLVRGSVQVAAVDTPSVESTSSAAGAAAPATGSGSTASSDEMREPASSPSKVSPGSARASAQAPRHAGGPAQAEEPMMPTAVRVRGPQLGSQPDAAWAASDAWLAGWLPHLQSRLGTLLRLLDYLEPRVHQYIAAESGQVQDTDIVLFIKHLSAVGVLPVPHMIVMRAYTPNDFTALWLSTFLWGTCVLRAQELPLVDATKVKLFTVTSARAATAQDSPDA